MSKAATKPKLSQADVVARFVALSSQRKMHIFMRLQMISEMPSKAMREGKAAAASVGEYVNTQVEKRSDLLFKLNAEIDRIVGTAR